ncbi:response regulator transcription factor [Alteromonadaceae bacterium BrNp21-10]|nr:response regulator transcription factor [Alteromonadaceae bacterium BrNp21-10]
MSSKTINILLAEDQGMLLGALGALLDLEPDFTVVYKANNGQQALDYLRDSSQTPVNIVLTDIEMPEMTGIELAEQIQQLQLPVKTLILTTFSRSGYLRRAMDAGVSGYLLKESPSEELAAAIRKVASGGKVIAPELMANAWMERDPLTDKERQALRLTFEGLSTEAIGEKLFLSAGTVRNYLSNAASKLQANNRVEAARIAHQNGWL